MDFLKRVGWLNLFLVFLPIAFILEWTHADATLVFLAAATAIIPLAGLMGKSTEMIAARLGPGIGGLMNASFGNAAEMIIAIFALKKGLVVVVKASIVGSILGNVLLVLGLSCLVGGLRYPRQKYNATAAGMSATLLALAAIGLVVPALFHAYLVAHDLKATAIEQDVSLEIAIVLFAVYVLNLIFSLKTHKHLYDGGHSATPPHSLASGDSAAALASAETTASESQSPVETPLDAKEHGHEHWPQGVAITVLIAATLGVALVSEVMIGAVEVASQTFGWTELFVGVVVIAIVGNAAEHSTAILVAYKNQMDLAFQIAVGSALQIALFVAPVLVFISYLPGFPQLDLNFSTLEVAAVTMSVVVIGLIAYDGQSNWLEGLLLLAVYGILGIAFFHLPEAEPHAPADETSQQFKIPRGEERLAVSARQSIPNEHSADAHQLRDAENATELRNRPAGESVLTRAFTLSQPEPQRVHYRSAGVWRSLRRASVNLRSMRLCAGGMNA